MRDIILVIIIILFIKLYADYYQIEYKHNNSIIEIGKLKSEIALLKSELGIYKVRMVNWYPQLKDDFKDEPHIFLEKKELTNAITPND